MAVYIPIVSEFNSKGIDRAVKEFKSLEKASDKANFLIRKAAVPAAAALAGLAVALGDSAKAAIEDQKGQLLLAKQLQNTTGATDKQIAANEQFIKDMMFATGVADDKLRPALAQLVRSSGSVEQAQKDLGLALDISAGTGRELSAVSSALAKAQLGNLSALTRLGIPLDQNIIKTKDYNKATEILSKTFEGAASASADTLEGRMRILRLRLDETKETIGNALIPVIERLLPLFTSVAKFAERNAPLFVTLAGGLAAFATAVVVARGALFAWKAIGVITTGINWALATSFTAVQVATGVGIATALAGAAAFVIIKKKMDAAKDSAVAYERALNPVITTQQELNNYVGPVASRDFTRFRSAVGSTIPTVNDLTKSNGEASKAAEKLNKSKEAAAKAAEELKKQERELAEQTEKTNARMEELRNTLREGFAKSLETATDKLNDAKQAFNDFAKGVADALTGSLNFQEAYKSGKETGSGFIAALTEQTKKIKNFGVLVNRLLAAGLSERALQQVLNAGVDAGTAIAEELLNSADGVIKANQLVSEVEQVGTQVGLNAADKFYQAGVTIAAALVKGVQDGLAALEAKITAPTTTLADLERMVNPALNAASGYGTGPLQFDPAQFNEFMRSGMPGFDVGGIGTFAFADGGIVTKPVLGLVGEAGPEAIIPLDKLGSMGGNQVTINVNGGDPNAVVSALRTYMRQNGSVPIRVSNIY